MGALAAAYRRLAPRRVHGIAATLLPYTDDGVIAWGAFEAHVARTAAAGLAVAVNMDTGFGDLLTPAKREAVLTPPAACSATASPSMPAPSATTTAISSPVTIAACAPSRRVAPCR